METKWRYDVKAGDIRPVGYQYRKRRKGEHAQWCPGRNDAVGTPVSDKVLGRVEYRFPVTGEPAVAAKESEDVMSETKTRSGSEWDRDLGRIIEAMHGRQSAPTAEAPVPPGYFAVRDSSGTELWIDVRRSPTVGRSEGRTWIDDGAMHRVCETPTEVLAKIAEAQRAERRATVVAAFTSPAQGDAIVVVTADGTCWSPSGGELGPVVSGIPIEARERVA